MNPAILIFLLFLFTFSFHTDSRARTYGEDGNRSVCVVYKGDTNSPFKEGEVTVWVYKRDNVKDLTNDDGMYYILVPKDVAKYQLCYSATNYYALTLENPISNDHDPEKVSKVTLRKIDAAQDSQDPKLEALLRSHGMTYCGTESPEIRRQIQSGLKNLLEGLQLGGFSKDTVEVVRGRLYTLDRCY